MIGKFLWLLNGSGRVFLVADDNAIEREMLKQELASHSLCPAGTADGNAVLELLRQGQSEGEPFLAALIDWTMPGVNPVELAVKIRSEAGFAGIHLVALVPLGNRLENGVLATT